MRNIRIFIGAAALGLSTVAQADMVATFAFSDLNAGYDGQSFSAASLGTLPTGGDVTDYSSPGFHSATFTSGLIGNRDFSDVLFSMDIGNITSTTADGTNGRFVIRDTDNDVLSGSFNGVWDFRFGFGFFDGEITFAGYTDNGDGFFEGTGGGDSFATPDGNYIGAISFLIRMPVWFSNSNGFAQRSAQGDGILVTPSPAGFALLGLGGLAATRRRRG